MITFSLKYRIALVVFILQIAIFTPLLWFTFTAYRDSDLKQLQTREDVFMGLVSQLGRKALLTAEPTDFQLFIAPFSTAPHIKRIVLLNQSGIVVASTVPTDLGGPAPVHTHGSDIVCKSSEIANATEQLGSISVHFSRAEMDKNIEALLKRGVPIALVSVILSALVGLGLGSLLTRRLKVLEQATRRMGEGDMGATVEISGNDEVAHLAQVFNEMSGSLRSQFEELEQIQQELSFQAQHDPLTGLPNRLLFDLRCSQSIAVARQHQHALALLFFDLDHFKNINDSYGHQIGDCVLRAVAARLTLVLKDHNLIARLGGDEFCVLIEKVEQQQEAAEVAQSILDMLAVPLECEQHEFFLSASIGICLYPRDGEDEVRLLRNADTAMYRAKTAGRGGYRFYSHEQTSSVQERTSLENRLRKAIERGELRLNYQPQVCLTTGNVLGVEALARWTSPEFGLVAPEKFIRIAEESGQIVSMGEWILEDACRQMQQWRASGSTIPRVAVNLSALQIQRSDIATLVRRTLDSTGLPANCLELEITEGYILQDADRAVEVLKQLRDLGVSIAIDDFGTGFSSLSYLHRLPIDRLKIDKSFVQEIGSTSRAAQVAQAVVSLGKTLGLSIIGEGVEQTSHADALREWGCHEAQGFLYAPALTPDQLHLLAPFKRKP
ncbi:MAG: EAL domain-containing protein [Geobacter sp.]|nr:EAL domain-containing protein [Geobacter sp.]